MRYMMLAVLCFSLCASVAWAAPPRLPVVAPEAAGLRADKLAQIDKVVARGLDNHQMPGCVVLVARHGKIAWLKAYGDRFQAPHQQAMQIDTVFDLASITKPVACATSVMKLIEQGKVELGAPVAKYLPEFAANGKDKITVEQLLIHQGGLIADNALSDYDHGVDEAWKRIYALKPTVEPGTKLIYSDVGFEVLGKLVEQVSGQDLNTFSREQFYTPLGLTETSYLPNEALRARAAPTEKRNGQWIQGEVHDPRAHRLGGVAGHAGLFSTAQDLAMYAQMLLNNGEYAGVRVLKAETVAEMTQARPVSSGKRALGWDVQTGFSSNRGTGLSDKAFGHGGFTGTVLWIDPERDLFYIFLSHRVHPNGKGSVNKLAGEIGTIVAESVIDK